MLLWIAVAALHAGPEPPSIDRVSLARLPRAIDDWRSLRDDPVPEDVLRMLGVDDHVSRDYDDVRGGGRVVGLYAGYYGSQRRGDTVHSPLACLPGTGWEIERVATAELRSPAAPVRVRQVFVRRGLERSALLYWYQGRGRIVAGDYEAKALLAWDGLVRGRTDGGMVRVIASVDGDEAAVLEDLRRFGAALLPRLASHFPG